MVCFRSFIKFGIFSFWWKFRDEQKMHVNTLAGKSIKLENCVLVMAWDLSTPSETNVLTA